MIDDCNVAELTTQQLTRKLVLWAAGRPRNEIAQLIIELAGRLEREGAQNNDEID